MKLKVPGTGTIVFSVALLVRVAWVLLRWSRSGAALEFPDEELHWQLAENLVNQGTLVSDDGRYAARMPGYPFFLAFFAWSGGTGVLVARFAQALLGAATAWIAYLLGTKVLGWRVGLVAGVLVCLDPYAIFFANLLLSEVLFGFLAVGLVACGWMLIGHDARSTRWPAVGVAVLGAAALMTRPSAAGCLVLLWIVLWLFDARHDRATRRVACWVGVAAICLLPWGLRNRAAVGAYAWLSTNGGVTLYDAQGPQADGSSNQAFLNELPELAGLGEVERDRELRRLANEQMRADPARVLSLAWTKFLRTWSLVPNVPGYRAGATGAASAVFTAIVLALAFVGLGRVLWPGAARREGERPGERLSRNFALPRRSIAHRDIVAQRRRLHVLLWLPVVYFTLLHCVFVGSLRYRVPLMPFLEIAAATAVVRVAGTVDRSRADSAR